MQDGDWQRVKDFAKLSDKEKAEFYANPTKAEYRMIEFFIMQQTMAELISRVSKLETKTKRIKRRGARKKKVKPE